ncbi:MAG: Diaminopimelate epimerase [Chlamydiales bacterium]|jgi:diaminopimelate epimerase|nr:Diaminopimelate epimerase [Chlamydiales bacterium]
MSQNLSFLKYSGCGNDFIFIDMSQHKELVIEKKVIQRLCHRQIGIGADGLILLKRGKHPIMEYYNCDGSFGEMCGNGLRCTAHAAYQLGWIEREGFIEVQGVPLAVKVEGDEVTAEIGPVLPHFFNEPFAFKGETLQVSFVTVGVPHAVVILEEPRDLDLQEIGPFLRSHPRFAKGANVNILKADPSSHTLSLRTYERGVEGETLACGSGAVASAFVYSQLQGMASEGQTWQIQVRSQDVLSVFFKPQGEAIAWLKGPATCIFTGQMPLAKALR